MLRLDTIQVAFGQHQVLKNFTCQVNEGDFVVIVGANGTGKTTLFDVISGKLRPNGGKVFLQGKDITNLSERQRAHFFSRLFQNPLVNCVTSMTVEENIALALYKNQTVGFRHGLSGISPLLLESISHFFDIPIQEVLRRPMGALSGGQRQMISFIMATLVHPTILLLDEPTAALDPQSATKLLRSAVRFIKEHSITAMMITHDPQLAQCMGNKVWVLGNGRVSKEFNEQEKEHLSPDKLIGHVDYASLRRS